MNESKIACSGMGTPITQGFASQWMKVGNFETQFIYTPPQRKDPSSILNSHLGMLGTRALVFNLILLILSLDPEV